MTMEEKKAWAEAILKSKYAELGKLPAKKDFDSVTCSRIKAYLGPWNRALESAGLKDPKPKKAKLEKNEKKGRSIDEKNEKNT